MIRDLKDILSFLLALGALGISLVFLPWAELNFTGDFPNWISAVTNYFNVNHIFNTMGSIKDWLGLFKPAHDQYNMGDYAYSLFLFAVITASAIAIILIGSEENMEKTVLEVKK